MSSVSLPMNSSSSISSSLSQDQQQLHQQHHHQQQIQIQHNYHTESSLFRLKNCWIRLKMAFSRLPGRAILGFLQRFGLMIVFLLLVCAHFASSQYNTYNTNSDSHNTNYRRPSQLDYQRAPDSLAALHTAHSQQVHHHSQHQQQQQVPHFGADAPPPLPSHPKEAIHFVSSHTSLIAPDHNDNWGDHVDRPYFPRDHDRLFSFGMDEQRIEEMETQLPTLLENYKNPCWYEEVPPHFTYNRSFFHKYYTNELGLLPHSDWQTTFKNMENRVQFRMRQSRDGRGWRLRCYPYYFVLGFTKAGTTDYCRILHMFPSVFTGIKKEPQFWNKLRSFPTVIPGERKPVRPTLADYLDLYDAAAEGIRHQSELSDGESYHNGIVGDCDPQTVWQLFSWDKMVGNDNNPDQPNYKTPHHLYNLHPKTKFIVLLRDPVERAFSHYRFFQVQKKNAQSVLDDFHDNVQRTVRLLESCTQIKTTRQCIHDRTLVPKSIHTSVTVGLYSTHIREWFRAFPRHQFLFLKSEDYFEKRASAIRETIDFLGLDIEEKDLRNIEEVAITNAGTSSGKTRMRPDTEKLLKDFYRPYNQDLVNLLQDQSFQWGY